MNILEAVQKNKIERVKELLRRDKSSINCFIWKEDGEGAYMTPLAEATRQKNSVLVRFLLEQEEIDVNAGYPLVHAVAQRGSMEIAKLLLKQKGIDVNAGNPLKEAVRAGEEEMVQLLLKQKGIDVNNDDPLGIAMAEGKEKIVRLLLNHQEINLDGQLTLAVYIGKEWLLELLLQHKGIDINENSGEPLNLAVARRSKLVELLLKQPKIDVNAGNPLMEAVRAGKEEMVQLLLKQKGIDVNNDNPLVQAINVGNEGVLALLLKHPKTDVNAAALSTAGRTEYDPITDMLNAAIAADSVLIQAEVGEINSRYHSIFFDRLANTIILYPDIAQYIRLSAFCQERPELKEKMLDIFGNSVFKNVVNGHLYEEINLRELDTSVTQDLFDAFKKMALDRGISDYTSVKNALNSELLPNDLIKKITTLIEASEETIDEFESIVRGEIEGISIMPTQLVKKGIKQSVNGAEEGEFDYQTDANTLRYYEQYPEEFNVVGAYLNRLNAVEFLTELQSRESVDALIYFAEIFTMHDFSNTIIPCSVKDKFAKIIPSFNEVLTVSNEVEVDVCESDITEQLMKVSFINTPHELAEERQLWGETKELNEVSQF